jgi:hypothetical protein
MDRDDRTEHHLGLHTVAVHVGQPQRGNPGTAVALFADPAAVEGIDYRARRPRRSRRGTLAEPWTPNLAFAQPHRASIALLHPGCTIAHRQHQALCPQVVGQHLQVNVVVARNDLVVHARKSSDLQNNFRLQVAPQPTVVASDSRYVTEARNPPLFRCSAKRRGEGPAHVAPVQSLGRKPPPLSAFQPRPLRKELGNLGHVSFRAVLTDHYGRRV